jgi:imidazolonepropionase-like amidohydrolase
VQIVQDVSVIAVDGATRIAHQDVVVDGDAIVSVQSTGAALAEGATVIDGRGRFLIPGLIDTHVHYYGEDEDEGDLGFDLDAINDAWSELCLINGVTTVLCLNGYPELLQLRDRIIAGEVAGPTIHSAGPILNDATMTYEQARAEIAAEAEIGYDFVKVYNELTADAYRGIVEEAGEQGIRFIGHVTRAPGLEGVLAAGQSSIVHAEEILYTGFDFRVSMGEFDWARNPPLRVEELPRICAAIKQAGVTMMPCVVAFYAIFQQAQDTHFWHRGEEFEGVDPKLIDLWVNPPDGRYVQQFAAPWARRNLLEAYWMQIRLIDELHRAGVPITAGTDWGIPGVVPGHLHLELSNLAFAGLGNDGALRSATQVGGEFLEPGTGLGTIAPGARADLVLLDADPLEDIRNAKRIQGVMARGRWHDRADLDARHDALRAAAANGARLTSA